MRPRHLELKEPGRGEEEIEDLLYKTLVLITRPLTFNFGPDEKPLEGFEPRGLHSNRAQLVTLLVTQRREEGVNKRLPSRLFRKR